MKYTQLFTICFGIIVTLKLQNFILAMPGPAPTPPLILVPCGLESHCNLTATTEEVCRYDSDIGCIRKYASKCHLDIAACRLRKKFSDVSNIYCSMDSYICEEGYERWTIFFGHEKD